MSVCGGGAWEMALATQLEEHITTNSICKYVVAIVEVVCAV